MKKRRKTERVFVRLTQEEKQRIEQLAADKDVSAAQIVREAVKTLVVTPER